MHPQSTYIFRHALTREVVYDSILTDRKKILHEEVGRPWKFFIRNDWRITAGSCPSISLKAETYEKGAEYSKMAGQKGRKDRLDG